jgi:outer membrane usher protein
MDKRGIWNADAFRGEIETNNIGNTQIRVKTGAVATKNSFFIGRPSADAFVLVDTDGIPGVEVSGPSDRYVTTNEKGFALFPGLSANVAQKLNINVDKLPLDVGIINEQQQVVPPQMSIVRAKFSLAKVNPVTAHLLDTAGKPVSRGAVAIISGQDNRVIGSDGALYLESAKEVKRIEVRAHKTTCVFDLPTPLTNEQTLRASRCN